MIHKRSKGSFTVEAALVMPVIFMVIFSLMYMSLILHDKVVLQSVAEEALVRCNQICQKPSDIMSSQIYYNRLLDVSLLGSEKEKHKDEVAYYIQQALKRTLVLCEMGSMNIVIEEDYCQVEITADSKIHLPMVLKAVGKNTQIKVEEERKYHNPGNFARQTEAIMGTVEQIKGMDRILEFLQKVNDFLGKS